MWKLAQRNPYLSVLTVLLALSLGVGGWQWIRHAFAEVVTCQCGGEICQCPAYDTDDPDEPEWCDVVCQIGTCDCTYLGCPREACLGCPRLPCACVPGCLSCNMNCPYLYPRCGGAPVSCATETGCLGALLGRCFCSSYCPADDPPCFQATIPPIRLERCGCQGAGCVSPPVCLCLLGECGSYGCPECEACTEPDPGTTITCDKYCGNAPCGGKRPCSCGNPGCDCDPVYCKAYSLTPTDKPYPCACWNCEWATPTCSCGTPGECPSASCVLVCSDGCRFATCPCPVLDMCGFDTCGGD